MVLKRSFVILFSIVFVSHIYAQRIDDSSLKQLNFYQDSLKKLGNTLINNDNDLVRKNANYQFIKTLVTALKTPNSFHFPFDSVKTIALVKSPDDKFRIFSWHVANDDGSYRFYGAIQANTNGPLKLYGLEDYSPLLKNPEDSVTDNRKWYGAQYYTIIPIQATTPYYVLLGWKGYTDRSTKKVIEVLSFHNYQPVLGMPIFDGNGKRRNRVVFEYTRQASMLLKYVPTQHLIVFDNLAPPDKKSKDRPETYGPDLTYNGYRLSNGRWQFVDNLDMRNVPNEQDESYIDPKESTERPKKAAPVKKKAVQ
ncbi:MAG: hypothetical protein V4560_14105 [Bacteroidota bacterium]